MRKLTALLLALMMLAMPLTALAEDTFQTFGEDYRTKALEAGRRIHYEITYGKLPDELANDPDVGVMMSALFDSIVIEQVEQGNESAVSIGFKRADGSVGSVLNVGYLTDGGDTYIKSNLLGESAIVVGTDDLLPLLGRLLGVLVEMGAIDAEEAMNMVVELPALIEVLEAQTVTLDLEDLMNLDYTALQAAILPILLKTEQVEMTMQPKNCDAAASEYLLVITQDDAKKVVTGLLTFIKDNPELMKLLESQMDPYAAIPVYAEMEVPTFEQQIDEAIAEIQAAEDTGETVLMRFWLDESGAEVCVQSYMVDAEGVVADTALMTYNRLTMNDKVAHFVNFNDAGAMMTIEVVLGADSLRASLSMDEDGEPYMSMLLDVSLVKSGNNVKTNMFVEIADYSYNEEVVRIDYQEDTTLNGVDFVSNVEVSVSFNGQELITGYGEIYTEDPAPSIKDGAVIRLVELTDAEFANWFAGVMNAIQSWPMTLLMNMPTEVVQTIMTNGM